MASNRAFFPARRAGCKRPRSGWAWNRHCVRVASNGKSRGKGAASEKELFSSLFFIMENAILILLFLLGVCLLGWAIWSLRQHASGPLSCIRRAMREFEKVLREFAKRLDEVGQVINEFDDALEEQRSGARRLVFSLGPGAAFIESIDITPAKDRVDHECSVLRLSLEELPKSFVEHGYVLCWYGYESFTSASLSISECKKAFSSISGIHSGQLAPYVKKVLIRLTALENWIGLCKAAVDNWKAEQEKWESQQHEEGVERPDQLPTTEEEDPPASQSKIAGNQPLTVRMRCNSCDRKFRVKQRLAGRRIKCPACGFPLREH